MGPWDLPDFVEVLPELHLRRVRAQLLEVRPEEHFAMENLGALLVRLRVHGSLKRGTPGLEGARCYVILEQLPVNDVDDCWDERLDIFAAGFERLNVT